VTPDDAPRGPNAPAQARGPAVSVVVVTYNSRGWLSAFIDALAPAVGGVAYELVVVDNGSTDDSVDLVRRLRPDAVVVPAGQNRGYAAGVNLGVSMSTARDAVLVCNPDVRLAPESVPRLLDGLSRPGVGVSAPRTTSDDGELVYSLRRDATLCRKLGEAILGGTRACRFRSLSQVVGNDDDYERAHAVDWAVGAVLMCSRACIDAVGPWDESFFLYAEEVDFQMRVRERGYAVWYVPDATAVHVGGDLHRSAKLWTLQTINGVRLYARRHNRAQVLAYWAACVLYEAVRVGREGGIHRAALRGLLRLRAGGSPPNG
jgi:GT2 family glycosyltransferase